MFGYGWYDSFHRELYHVGDQVVFQDSDGSCLAFEKNGDSYTCEETKEYTLEEEPEEQEKTYELEEKTEAIVVLVLFLLFFFFLCFFLF